MALIPLRRRAEAFADLLETSRATAGARTGADEQPRLLEVVGAVRALPQQPGLDSAGPGAAFASELRERLVTEAARRPVRSPSPRRPVDDRPASSLGARSRRPLKALVAAGLALAITCGSAGTVYAAQSALPGDSLYGIKRGVESVQLALARGSVARGHELLQEANARLAEVEGLVANRRDELSPERYRLLLSQTWADMDSSLREGTELLTEAYRNDGDAEVLHSLDEFANGMAPRVAHLGPQLPATVRSAQVDLLSRLRGLRHDVGALLDCTGGCNASQLRLGAGDASAGGGREDHASGSGTSHQGSAGTPVDGTANGGQAAPVPQPTGVIAPAPAPDPGTDDGSSAPGASSGTDQSVVQSSDGSAQPPDVTDPPATSQPPEIVPSATESPVPDVTTPPVPDETTPPVPVETTPPVPEVTTPPVPEETTPPVGTAPPTGDGTG